MMYEYDVVQRISGEWKIKARRVRFDAAVALASALSGYRGTRIEQGVYSYGADVRVVQW